MKNLLKIVTECIDKFSKEKDIIRQAAIIGGEAVILHGIPRTTIDIDILLFFGGEEDYASGFVRLFATFLKKEMGKRFNVKEFEASKDLTDPLKHDLIIITDSENKFKKLDILIANYKWELDGLRSMDNPNNGPLQIFPMPYLLAMKLMAGGAQDEEDIRNLFIIMSDLEKEKSWELARLIRRDKKLSKILSERRRYIQEDRNSVLENLKIKSERLNDSDIENE